MYIQKEEIKKLAQKIKLIEPFEEENFHNIAYDLRVDKIHWLDQNNSQTHKSHTLKPGDSIFVSTKECIKVPNDMFGQIIPRNSCIRGGLEIAAPVYQPGHYTRVFVRVTNIADSEITISENMSVFSIMFYRLANEVSEPYQGAFVNQFDFYKVNGIHSVQTAIAVAAKADKEEITSIVRNIYATVITLMAIFVTMFSVIVMNGKFIPEIHNGFGVLFLNLVLVGTMAAFIAMISLLLNKLSNTTRGILISLAVVCGCAAAQCLQYM